MKTDDKFPEEMLEDIREAAVKARDAANDLAYAIRNMRKHYTYTDEIDYLKPVAIEEMPWWQKIADRFEADATEIEDRANELIDAEDETAEEGGEE